VEQKRKEKGGREGGEGKVRSGKIDQRDSLTFSASFDYIVIDSTYGFAKLSKPANRRWLEGGKEGREERKESADGKE